MASASTSLCSADASFQPLAELPALIFEYTMAWLKAEAKFLCTAFSNLSWKLISGSSIPSRNVWLNELTESLCRATNYKLQPKKLEPAHRGSIFIQRVIRMKTQSEFSPKKWEPTKLNLNSIHSQMNIKGVKSKKIDNALNRSTTIRIDFFHTIHFIADTHHIHHHQFIITLLRNEIDYARQPNPRGISDSFRCTIIPTLQSEQN